MIQPVTHRPELLAPAGRWDVLEAVVDAGADAVYLGSKQWNMRMHRGDFHFTPQQIADAAELLHAHGRRLYVTVNNLLSDEEVERVAPFLQFCESAGVDAVIVQDLAAVALTRDLALAMETHASTMLNVHCPAMARALRRLGVTRVITSRDIDIHQAARIAAESGVEVEYFVHGDMCVAQSGQCHLSGVAMGKSANRGECMKPCRWDYELVTLGENGSAAEVVGRGADGHLLSIKDLSLLRNLPALIGAGIASLKIEGRMRDADYLGHLVRLYRTAIDDYLASPPTYFTRLTELEQMHRRQQRQTSALVALGGSPNKSLFDTSGKREIIHLSDGVREPRLSIETINAGVGTPDQRVVPALGVCVSNIPAAEAAIEAGADRLLLAAETWQLRHESPWGVGEMADAARLARAAGAMVVLRTPRITTAREWRETAWLMGRLADAGIDRVLVSHYGLIELVRDALPSAEPAADFGLNVLNATSADLLAELGCVEVTASIEAGLDDIASIGGRCSVPLEVIGHGPVAGMVIEHCVVALNTGAGSKDVCRGPCQRVAFALRDRAGELRPIVTDQYCRNHYLAAAEACTLGMLGQLADLGLAALRIEAQFYPQLKQVGEVTRRYRRKLDAVAAGEDESVSPDEFAAMAANSPLGLARGGLDKHVTNSEKTARVVRQLRAAAGERHR